MSSPEHLVEQHIPGSKWIDLRCCSAILWWTPECVHTVSLVNDTAIIEGNTFIIYNIFLLVHIFCAKPHIYNENALQLCFICLRGSYCWAVTGFCDNWENRWKSPSPVQLKPPVCLIFPGRKWRWHTNSPTLSAVSWSFLLSDSTFPLLGQRKCVWREV